MLEPDEPRKKEHPQAESVCTHSVRAVVQLRGNEVCMQPMSDDAYKRKLPSKQLQQQQQASTKAEMYEDQEDQWALLQHEVVDEELQRQSTSTHWEPRDTEGKTHSSQSTSNFSPLTTATHRVDIVVVGVGGGGMNAINRMIAAQVRGVRFIAMNTDAQVLSLSQAEERICLGQHHTKGLGAGGNAAVGMRAATESAAEIRAALGDADLIFIAAGMGGGTGTGAAPVVASIARKLGALTVGIVTLPFMFEGSRRRRIAQQGIEDLSAEIDALITIPNDRLLTTFARDQSLTDAFKIADDVLRQGVQGIAEVINVPGMVNVDFADVRSVLHDAGTALMSIGQGQGRNRAQIAAEEAIAGGFLNVTIRGAKRVLFNISGGEDMTLFEVNEVAERIGAAIDDAADIIFGAVIDPALKDTIHVTLIAAGMEEIQHMRASTGYAEPFRTSASSLGTRGQALQQNSARSPLPPSIVRPILPPTPPPTQMPPSIHQQDQRGQAKPQRNLHMPRKSRPLAEQQERYPGQASEKKDDAITPPPFLRWRD